MSIAYAQRREEIRAMSPGEMVLAIERTEAFETVMLPALETADHERARPLPGERKRRGRRPSFFALDYFRLEALRRCLGKRSTQATRDWLAGDKAAQTRRELDFARDCAHYGGKARKLMAGIPSDGWMSDFRTKWLTEEHFALLWQDMQRQTLQEVLRTIPGVREEARTLFADGSLLLTHATAPKRKRKGGPVTNADAVTAPTAGYISAKEGSENHCGEGWNLIFIMTGRGTVVGSKTVPLHAPEAEALAETLPDAIGALDEGLGGRDLRALSADGGFNSQPLRHVARNHGVIENIHLASHSNGDTSRAESAKRNRKRIAIDRHPNWHTNGHRELGCACGGGKVSRRVSLNAEGKTVTRVQGECATCGSVTLTSGRWRIAKNPAHFVRMKADAVDAKGKPAADLTLGNPLTFNDQLAKEYGTPRFHGQEGAFGSQFTQRFQLVSGQRWFYRQSQVDLEVAMVITITHALRLERWRRMEATGALDDRGEAANARTGLNQAA